MDYDEQEIPKKRLKNSHQEKEKVIFSEDSKSTSTLELTHDNKEQKISEKGVATLLGSIKQEEMSHNTYSYDPIQVKTEIKLEDYDYKENEVFKEETKFHDEDKKENELEIMKIINEFEEPVEYHKPKIESAIHKEQKPKKVYSIRDQAFNLMKYYKMTESDPGISITQVTRTLNVPKPTFFRWLQNQGQIMKIHSANEDFALKNHKFIQRLTEKASNQDSEWK